MMGERWSRIRVVLAHQRLPWALVCVAIVLSVPSLFGGLQADDWWHRVILHQRALVAAPKMPAPLFVFTAYDGDPVLTRWGVDHGIGAWWAEPTLRLNFFRPLTAATHMLDYALWPDAPWAMHAQSIVWFVACVLVAGALYRRILGATWVAGAAALLFTIDPTHGMGVGWIALRNTLVSAALGFASLLAHDRARKDGSLAAAVLSPALLAAALLSGESALGIVGFLVAYAVMLDDAPARTRARALLPHLGVVAGWAFVYRHWGFGTRGSAMYVDPVGSPLRFLGAVLTRGPADLAAEIGGPPPDPWAFASRGVIVVIVAIALVSLALAAWTLAPLRKQPAVRFFVLGMLLAVVPICATTPTSRVLMVPSFGGMGLLALLVEALREGRLRGTVARAWACWATGSHVVLGAPLFVFASLQLAIVQRGADRLVVDASRTAPVERMVVVNPADCTFVGLLSLAAALRGMPAPARALGLAPGMRASELERIDDRTLTVRTFGGFAQTELDGIGRDPRDPLPIGSSIELTGVTIVVTATTSDGRPEAASFRFATPLEDPALVWMRWDGTHLVPFVLPAIGTRVTVPATSIL